jgi:tripartite-type tricarboxylate transporter receptor subunit TctC
MAGKILKAWLIGALAALTMAAPPSPAQAQGKYPDKPVRIVLPFGAGGVADVTARIVADKLGDKLGQRFIVENQPGAGGIAAARSVLSAAPDGHTLALFSNGTAVSVGLF